MLKKKTMKIILICVFLFFIAVITGYHGYCHHMVSEFYKCVDEGNTEKIIACIEKMPDVNMLDVCIPLYKIRGILLQGALSNGYPIYYAVWKQTDISVMEALLEKGADLNIMADHDLTLKCLLRDHQKDLYEKVQLFVEYGADISEINASYAPIPLPTWEISEHTREEWMNTVVFLWECGIDEWEHVGTRYERTILHELAKFVEVNYLEMLYNNEQRPMDSLLNEKDANGETPLFFAVRANNPANCEFLIGEGADVDIRNNEGKTAYDVALELEYDECIELLEL